MKKSDIVFVVLFVILVLVIVLLVCFNDNNSNNNSEIDDFKYDKENVIKNYDDKILLVADKNNEIVYIDKSNNYLRRFKLKDGKYRITEEDSIYVHFENDEPVALIFNFDPIECVADMCIESSEGEYLPVAYENVFYVGLKNVSYSYENEFVYIYEEGQKLYGLKYEKMLAINNNSEFVDRLTTYELKSKTEKKEIKVYDGKHYKKEETIGGTYYLRSHWGGTDSPTYDIVYNDSKEELFDGIRGLDYELDKEGNLYYLSNGLNRYSYQNGKETMNVFDDYNHISKSINNNNMYVSGVKDGILMVYNVNTGKYSTIDHDLPKNYSFANLLEKYQTTASYDVYISLYGDEDNSYCRELFFTERNNKILEFKTDCWGKELE